MSEPDITTLIRDYVAAWSEPQETTRQSLLQRVWADDGIYTDPSAYADGCDALSAIIGKLHQRAPGARFQITSGIDAHHGFVRFAWQLTFADGTSMQGMDFGEVAGDGRLCKIVGFF